MGPNTRVFRTYLDERAIFDANMIGESRDSVDVLLVFAGLFSAVVTTFVVMQKYPRTCCSRLSTFSALASGVSLDIVAPSPLNPNMPFIATTTSVWVNGLWFTSLSLATALVSMLAKKWLHHYVLLPSGTPRERSLLRQFRYAGLQKWRVLVILMHTAPAIFFFGLVNYLGPLMFRWYYYSSCLYSLLDGKHPSPHLSPMPIPDVAVRSGPCYLQLRFALPRSLLLAHTIRRLFPNLNGRT
ncbi:hypothetical protein ARMGADRAFT_989226 [Armillaria gallica]|uniref:DUF6535 domain-containing protein n=1 Tax=Armillaria gallica TaxID=47427 RepID=A0A2H3DP31_ARMGA|nr:hypothetical protein ARMGADRAFT_989226 [Armillaria gallica]